MNLDTVLPKVRKYLEQRKLTNLDSWHPSQPFEVSPLAQGEYNLNYLVCQDSREWVFRVNIASQIGREDQISYEYETLKLLEKTGNTPEAFFCDKSKTRLPYGVLVMEYLPGEPLDYRRDIGKAARLFARIHNQKFAEKPRHLLNEKQPLSMMFEECRQLLAVYLQSTMAEEEISNYLRKVMQWASKAKDRENFFIEHPVRCVINTEVNSHNFIVNRKKKSIHLVDWEKPLWGDPSQDLSHFCAPTTTKWKTEYVMSPKERKKFLATYCSCLEDQGLKSSIRYRVKLRDPFNYLRGISWSAMAWVEYQTGKHQVKNEDTFHKIEQYLDLEFLHFLFDGFLAPGQT